MAGFKFKLEQGSGTTAESPRRKLRWMAIFGGLIALVVVLVLVGASLNRQAATPVAPSDDFMSRSLKALEADDLGAMSSLSNEITQTNRYRSSPDYLILLTFFSLAKLDAATADNSLTQLKKLDASVFQTGKWTNKSEIIKHLEQKLKTLKEFKEAEKGRKSGFEGVRNYA